MDLHGFTQRHRDSPLKIYLQGIYTFRNPEAVNINVLATPGTDYNENNSLVGLTIDMVEEERADSVYILTSPENVEVENDDPLVGFGFNQVTINDAASLVDLLDAADIDSNYTCTYWPWIQERDSENSVKRLVTTNIRSSKKHCIN